MSEVENSPTPSQVVDQKKTEEAKKTSEDTTTNAGDNKNGTTNGNDQTNGFNWEAANNLYEFSVKDLDGNDVSLSKYKGNVVLIVNVASNCGLTKSNYNQLNTLYEKYESQGLRIAAFPCNQFAGQEPGCEADIKEFANKNAVKFDVYAKIDVNGSNAHPLYRWLKTKQRGFLIQGIKWNFTKFLINKDGIPIRRFGPTTSPNSIEPEISALLKQTENSK